MLLARPNPRTWLIALLLGAVALTSWLNFAAREQTVNTERLLPRIDHSLSGFRATGFDERGLPAWRLEGERVDHLAWEGGYALTNPKVAYYDSGTAGVSGPPWTLSAPEGDADERLDNVLLRGGVVAARDATGDVGRLKMQSEQVWLRPRMGLAGSERPTRIQEENAWHSDADGFTLEREGQRLEQPRVRDHFLPGGTRTNNGT